MTGPEMVTQMREDDTLKHVPVILLTAKSDAENKIKATLAGADAFLGKPFDEAELCAEVRNLLALKSREREVEALNRRLVEQGLARVLPPAVLETLVKGENDAAQHPE